MSKLKCLDLFCKAGGTSMGYYRAGFDITGVDIKPQKRYPFKFIQADALEYLEQHWQEYDFIAASPPCQAYSWLTPESHKKNHPNLIEPLRQLLKITSKAYAIENVGGARKELFNPIKLCGSMFGLMCYRHRYFEVKPNIKLDLYCNHNFKPLLVTTAGSNSRAIRKQGNYKSVKNAPLAYGIDWMIADELKEAIPPAYTEFIGKQIIKLI